MPRRQDHLTKGLRELAVALEDCGSPCPPCPSAPQVRLHRCPPRAQGLKEVDPGDGCGARAVRQPAVPPPGHHARAASSPRGVSGPCRCHRPQSGLSLEYVALGERFSGTAWHTALSGCSHDSTRNMHTSNAHRKSHLYKPTVWNDLSRHVGRWPWAHFCTRPHVYFRLLLRLCTHAQPRVRSPCSLLDPVKGIVGKELSQCLPLTVREETDVRAGK